MEARFCDGLDFLTIRGQGHQRAHFGGTSGFEDK
jgi:hypothetical protein